MSLFILNLILAIVWTLLNNDPGVVTFIFGFVLGFILLFLFQPARFMHKKVKESHASNYFKRMLSFFRFSLWFFVEFLKANLNVAIKVLSCPNHQLHPHILKVGVKDLTSFEIVFLAQCITITPGTTTVKISDNQHILYFHALDATDTKKVWESVDKNLKPRILNFTR